MGIVYDAPSNTITVTGYTEDTPCTFVDVWNADQAGGWGVVSKQGTAQYLFDCKLYIGTQDVVGWLADTDKQVAFSSNITITPIYIAKYGHFRIGQLDDFATKTGSHGCSIISFQTVAGTTIYKNNWEGDCEIYASQITCVNVLGQIYANQQSYSIVRLWYSTLSQVTIYLGSIDLYKVKVLGGTWGLYRPGQVPMEDVEVSGCTYGLRFQDYGRTLTDLTMRNCTTEIYIVNFNKPGSDAYLINCDLESWSFDYYGTSNPNRLYRQYKVNLHVVDAAGANVNGATVTLKDKDENEIFSVETAADGTIAEQTVSYGYYQQDTGGTLQDYGPFCLTVTKAGYMPYPYEGIVLDKPVDWRIGLRSQLSGDADPADVIEGATFYKDDADAKLTGTLVPIIDALPFAAEVASASVTAAVAAIAIEVEVAT